MIKRLVIAIMLVLISTHIAVAQYSARPSKFALTFCVNEKANIRSEPSTAGGDSTIIRTAVRGEQLIVVDGLIGEIPAGWQNNIFWYELRDGYYVYSGIVRPCPPPLSPNTAVHEPRINEVPDNEIKISSILNLLRDKNSELYAFVQVEGVTIEAGPHAACAGGAFLKKIELWMGEHCSREYMAAILVHEYCHIWQHEEGLSKNLLRRERACLRLNIIAGFALGLDRKVLERDQMRLKHISKPECQWWKKTWDRDKCQSHSL